jgi:hypothetical protein
MWKKFKKYFIVFSLILGMGVLVYLPVLAANEAIKTVSLENPLAKNLSPSEVIGLFIKAALGLVGGLTLVMVVFGGFQWLTAAGNKEKISAGTKTMTWAIIGLILVLGSYLLLTTILNALANRGTT